MPCVSTATCWIFCEAGGPGRQERINAALRKVVGEVEANSLDERSGMRGASGKIAPDFDAVIKAARVPLVPKAIVEELTKKFQKIPWSSFGRETPIARLAHSILPVGNFPMRLPSGDQAIIASSTDPQFEKYLMEIEGTAFQVGRGKLITCWHVCQALKVKEGFAYIQSTVRRDGVMLKGYWPIVRQFSFIDPRHGRGNKDIDVGIVICPAVGTDVVPYETPKVVWGDSTQVGVGDRVLIGGFPLGKEMFLTLATNRGIVQPTFYDGVISAVLPATKDTETRLFQISSIAIGGISGGVVCDPETGAVLGMVTSGLDNLQTGQSLPITYAIPSEILQPYADAISFTTKDGKSWS